MNVLIQYPIILQGDVSLTVLFFCSHKYIDLNWFLIFKVKQSLIDYEMYYIIIY